VHRDDTPPILRISQGDGEGTCLHERAWWGIVLMPLSSRLELCACVIIGGREGYDGRAGRDLVRLCSSEMSENLAKHHGS